MKEKLPAFANRLAIGNGVGLTVSPYCVGMTTPDTVEAAFTAGINFFFLSADMHWPLYEGTRRGIERLCARGLRDRIVVCATSYLTQEEFSTIPFQEVIDAVPGLERLDILCAGGMYGRDLGPRLHVYMGHRERRHCGTFAIGASFHDRVAASLSLQRELFDVGFIRFNPVHRGAKRDVFPAVTKSTRMRLFAFKTSEGWQPEAVLKKRGLEEDNWFPSRPDFYRYALSQPGLDGLLWAPQKPAHIEALGRSIDEGPLDDDECLHLESIC